MKGEKAIIGSFIISIIFYVIAGIFIIHASSVSKKTIEKDITEKYLFINLVELKKKADYLNTILDVFLNYKTKEPIMSFGYEILVKDFLRELETTRDLTELYIKNHQNQKIDNFSKKLANYLITLKSDKYSLNIKIKNLKQITKALIEMLPKIINIVNSTL